MLCSGGWHVSARILAIRLLVRGRPMPVIEVAIKVSLDAETDKDADRRRGRHRDEQADETEQCAEGEQSEHQPDGVQADALADELWPRETDR